jgi:hypothetical protein
MIDLDEIRRKTLSVDEYLSTIGSIEEELLYILFQKK